MTETTHRTFVSQVATVRHVRTDRPWEWLRLGWDDFRAAPAVGLTYGAVFALAGYLMVLGLRAFDTLFMIIPLTAGFMLLGPFLAVGLYEIARRRERGERPGLADAVSAYRRNPAGLAVMGGILLVFMVAWVNLAGILFMLFFGSNPPNPNMFFSQVFLSPDAFGFVLTGTLTGAVLAFCAFAVSAVSVPMLMDRDVSAFGAVLTSIDTVLRNWKPMILWAGLVTLYTGVGLATMFIGLIVTLPLIGYATWHAYRDLVER